MPESTQPFRKSNFAVAAIFFAAQSAIAADGDLVGLWIQKGSDRSAIEFRADGLMRVDVTPESLNQTQQPMLRQQWKAVGSNQLKLTRTLGTKEISSELFLYKFPNPAELELSSANGAQVRVFSRVSREAFQKLPLPGPKSWVYKEIPDKMRGGKSFEADAESAKQPDGTYVQLALLKPAQGGFTIGLSTVATKPFSLDCLPICKLQFKFDSGPPRQYNFRLGGNGATSLFVYDDKDAKALLAEIRKSSMVMTELSFLNHGSQQFEFAISGLRWD